MKQILLSIIIASISFGCKSYIQLFETKTSNTKVENDFYVFENDSLKITYDFWADMGLMKFSIYNKTNKPLYIDWKKSAYIDNKVKLSYWIDEETTKLSEYYGSYFFSAIIFQGIGVGVGSGSVSATASTVKAERVTFIPPLSNISRSQFYIPPDKYFEVDKKWTLKELPSNDNPKKKTKVYMKSYSKKDSPVFFRNFLTFSGYEDFRSEFYVDNEFYISDITQMNEEDFGHNQKDESVKVGKFYVKDEYGNPIFVTPFKKNSSFYIKIPAK